MFKIQVALLFIQNFKNKKKVNINVWTVLFHVTPLHVHDSIFLPGDGQAK